LGQLAHVRVVVAKSPACLRGESVRCDFAQLGLNSAHLLADFGQLSLEVACLFIPVGGQALQPLLEFGGPLPQLPAVLLKLAGFG
jgi:hypothetical protein